MARAVGCRDVMKPQVFTCGPDTSVQACAKIMAEHNVGIVPVVEDNGRLAGVVTDRDVAVRTVAQGRSEQGAVAEIMTRDVITCREDDSLQHVEDRLTSAQKSRIVVVDAWNNPVGIVSLSDVGRVEDAARAGEVFKAVVTREATGLLARK